ncbi:MAG TPA: helix-turn-helix domain-containing protein [Candidatus Acidoferrales bacterium]|nr:helix-turn-helix domain-containing protein [Candidatus Acidoferrales bacterium]
MDRKSRKAEHAAATRTALLKTARRLFAERGYAATATEEVVRRARVTRGALYHHFSDKRDLFKAVFQEEEQKLAARVTAAGACESTPWNRLRAGCAAFLDACLDPAVQHIVLIDAPSVLGWEGWRDIDAGYFLQGIKVALQAAIDAHDIAPQPVDAAAHVLFGALHEAAMMIAHADDEAAARRDVSGVIERVLAGIRSAAA